MGRAVRFRAVRFRAVRFPLQFMFWMNVPIVIHALHSDLCTVSQHRSGHVLSAVYRTLFTYAVI
jgi:hypothetical protein